MSAYSHNSGIMMKLYVYSCRYAITTAAISLNLVAVIALSGMCLLFVTLQSTNIVLHACC